MGLEVGCGPGSLSEEVHQLGVEMTGIDRSPAMIARARRQVEGVRFLQGDGMALPVETDGVDVAFAASVVNVVSTPLQLVKEMKRVVRPGGTVSVLFPTPALSREAERIGKDYQLTGLSAAALHTWGGRAPKLECAEGERLFVDAGLLKIRVDRFFEGSVVSLTGTVP